MTNKTVSEPYTFIDVQAKVFSELAYYTIIPVYEYKR